MNRLTDVQKAQLFLLLVIYNQLSWAACVILLKRDNKFLIKKVNELYDVLGVTLETAHIDDPRLQKFGIDTEFELITTRDEELKKLQKWWKRR